jgi:predicted CoA-binding protein
MESKKTLVVGGSPNPSRYSNMAINRLRSKNHEVVSIGRKESKVADVDILTGKPNFEDIHTVTMYVGPQNQNEFMDYLVDLKPKRIIFNPGTENYEFESKAQNEGIEVVNNCTLVMLSLDIF